MASFEVVNKALLKVFDCINVLLGAPNNHVGKKTSHNLIKVLLLIRACWKEILSIINKCAALLLGTPE